MNFVSFPDTGRKSVREMASEENAFIILWKILFFVAPKNINIQNIH